MTAAEVARQLGFYRSNFSAMDAGSRSVSVKTLARVSKVLGCSPGDLIEVHWEPEGPIFRNRLLQQRMEKRDYSTPDGLERGWVHAVLLAWQRHGGFRR